MRVKFKLKTEGFCSEMLEVNLLNNPEMISRMNGGETLAIKIPEILS